jgi:hypothetical protein
MRFIIILMLITLQITAQTVIEKAISAEDHNRKRPLFEALDAGFKGIALTVEVNKTGELMCGKKSFSETYLAPLKARIDQNNGWIYADKIEEFIVVVDFKSDSNQTYASFSKAIAPYYDILTSFEANKRIKKAVKIIVTGNVPRKEILNTEKRYCTLDEPINKLNNDIDAMHISMSTINFKKIFDWKGEGSMPNMQYHGYTTYIKLAHKLGRTVRVKNIPENANAIGILSEAGVDLIEINDIQKFLIYTSNN